jgi:hypothetical protein
VKEREDLRECWFRYNPTASMDYYIRLNYHNTFQYHLENQFATVPVHQHTNPACFCTIFRIISNGATCLYMRKIFAMACRLGCTRNALAIMHYHCDRNSLFSMANLQECVKSANVFAVQWFLKNMKQSDDPRKISMLLNYADLLHLAAIGASWQTVECLVENMHKIFGWLPKLRSSVQGIRPESVYFFLITNNLAYARHVAKKYNISREEVMLVHKQDRESHFLRIGIGNVKANYSFLTEENLQHVFNSPTFNLITDSGIVDF